MFHVTSLHGPVLEAFHGADASSFLDGDGPFIVPIFGPIVFWEPAFTDGVIAVDVDGCVSVVDDVAGELQPQGSRDKECAFRVVCGGVLDVFCVGAVGDGDAEGLLGAQVLVDDVSHAWNSRYSRPSPPTTVMPASRRASMSSAGATSSLEAAS